ncbi:hypothetical protein [uncultured Williamsia sp.]|uniref:hypothetical protein n=1 Tax=uncultured Williamsia sp. TaxID=259311 RepID=UPI00260A0780|nr:hypothetical protein [uncultured Williamsia sp.]
MIPPSLHFPHVDPLLAVAFWIAVGGVIGLGLAAAGVVVVHRRALARSERDERRVALRAGVYRVRRPDGGFVVSDPRPGHHHRTHGFLGARYSVFTDEQWARLAAIRDSGTTPPPSGYRIERLDDRGKWAAIVRVPVAV